MGATATPHERAYLKNRIVDGPLVCHNLIALGGSDAGITPIGRSCSYHHKALSLCNGYPVAIAKMVNIIRDVNW